MGSEKRAKKIKKQNRKNGTTKNVLKTSVLENISDDEFENENQDTAQGEEVGADERAVDNGTGEAGRRSRGRVEEDQGGDGGGVEDDDGGLCGIA